MSFAAGSDVRERPLSTGFTLVEVVLVIGLLVLIIGVTGLWVQRGMFDSGQRSPQEVFLAASAQARVLAMQQGKPVLLVFDEQAQGFRLNVLDAENPGGQGVGQDGLPWLEESNSRMRRSFVNRGAAAQGARESGGAGGGSATERGGSDANFFALPQGGRMAVTFYLLYGEEGVTLPQLPEGIRYHPSGVSAPVQVRMHEQDTGFRLTLLPDNLSSGLRMDEQALQTNGSATGGWR